MTTKRESNKGDYRGETEEEFYQRILKGPYQELDEIVLGLLDKKAGLIEWLVKNDYDKDKFTRVLEEAYEKLFAVDYFESRFLDFMPPDSKGPHNEMRERIRGLIYMLQQIEPLVPQAKRGKRFIEGSKGPRERDSPKKEAFKKWVRDFNIDPYLPLDDLVVLVEDAFVRGEIKTPIGKNTINDCLPTIRKKK